MNIQNGFLFFYYTTQFMVFTYKFGFVSSYYFGAVLLTCFMISIMHEDFRENITWDCFCFSWIQKYMLMGYIYCHSESMFVALNIVVKEKKKKTTMSWEYQSKRTFFFISILPKMFYHWDVLLSLFHYLLRLTSVPAHKMPKQWSSKMHKSQ